MPYVFFKLFLVHVDYMEFLLYALFSTHYKNLKVLLMCTSSLSILIVTGNPITEKKHCNKKDQTALELSKVIGIVHIKLYVL